MDKLTCDYYYYYFYGMGMSARSTSLVTALCTNVGTVPHWKSQLAAIDPNPLAMAEYPIPVQYSPKRKSEIR